MILQRIIGPMVTKILTVGYEGGSAEDLLYTLKEHDVRVLLDIREMPLSRKPGLSKKALDESVSRLGIQYCHERALGAPKPIREALKTSGDYRAYFVGFDAYLETQRDLLQEVCARFDGVIALMCFERDPDYCHRKSVARVLGEMVGIKPQHIGVQRAPALSRQNLHPGQSLSAA